MTTAQGNKWGISPVVITDGQSFEDWTREYFHGDHAAAVWVVEQAIDVVQDLMDGNTPPIYGMLLGMMVINLCGASCDMDGKNLGQLIKDHAPITYDIARRLIQHRVNEMEEYLRRGPTERVM